MQDQILWHPGLSLAELERRVIVKAYAYHNFNKTRTAQSLGVSAKTIDNKLDQYEKEKEEETKRTSDIKRKNEAWGYLSRGKPLPDHLKEFAPKPVENVLVYEEQREEIKKPKEIQVTKIKKS